MISVVVPILNEAENLSELRLRVVEQLDRAGEAWELILVNDGSSDGSAELMARMHAQDARIKALVLSRTFGHQPAIAAGLSHARGDCVVLMDGDLQDPPELIPALLERWRAGFQVVVAERRTRADRGLRGAALRMFYPVFRWVSDNSSAPDAGVFGLMDRVVVDALGQIPEHNRYIPGLRSWLGFRQTAVPYDRQPRARGNPKQGWGHLTRYATDAVFGFSRVPLRLATVLGLCFTILSLTFGAAVVVRRFVFHQPVTTFGEMVVVGMLLGGVQLVSIGVLGEYVGRIYELADGLRT